MPARPAPVRAIDGLRGVAALGIVIYHMRPALAYAPELRFAAGAFEKYFLLLDLFFVVSGFAIASGYGDVFSRRVAAAEAKLQLGSSSVDAQMQDIEREAMDIQLQDKLLEYKSQMGMLGAGSPEPSKQISANSSVQEAEVLNTSIFDETNEKSHSN